MMKETKIKAIIYQEIKDFVQMVNNLYFINENFVRDKVNCIKGLRHFIDIHRFHNNTLKINHSRLGLYWDIKDFIDEIEKYLSMFKGENIENINKNAKEYFLYVIHDADHYGFDLICTEGYFDALKSGNEHVFFMNR